jgi:hypothetical protein
MIDERCLEMGVASVNVLEPVINLSRSISARRHGGGSAHSM